MNFFAHALPHLSQPWFLAGVSLPDWLSVVNRRVRLKRKKTALRVSDPQIDLSTVARGIVQHHQDDEWFHESKEFAILNLELSVELRSRLVDQDSLRTWFVSHILIEILLDAYLDELNPGMLDKYYAQLATVDPIRLQEIVEDLSGAPNLPLAAFLPKFIESRFLYDYRDASRLLFRINQVLNRVGLVRLPEATVDWIESVRPRVYDQAPSLLGGLETRFTTDRRKWILQSVTKDEGAA